LTSRPVTIFFKKLNTLRGNNRMTSGSFGETECPDADGVLRRLAELQVPWPTLKEALRRGHLAGDFCTQAHARTYRGLRVYHEVNGELRGQLAVHAWLFDDADNIPRAIRPDRQVVITAVSGNAQTGLSGDGAQTRNRRGGAGIRIVEQNAQISLLDLLLENERERLGEQLTQTWFLLFYRDGDIIRSELSLADGVTVDGTLLRWAERLILPEFYLYEGDSSPVEGPTPPAVASDVDVPVTRRSA
jgi:hypothetical protein